MYIQEEELDEKKVQVIPPGFHIIFLPFADDFRKIKMEENLARGTTLHLWICCEAVWTSCFPSTVGKEGGAALDLTYH